ncbi:MAG: hypothetical protein AAB919_01110 [Patescibacteria group bacterium]
MNNIIVAAVIALVLGAGGGYVTGKSSVNTQQNDKQLQDAVTMMKSQSSNIKQMGDMMKSGGTMMQDMGMKYKEDTLVQQGKDMQAIGEKYLEENTKDTKASGMQQMMAQ